MNVFNCSPLRTTFTLFSGGGLFKTGVIWSDPELWMAESSGAVPEIILYENIRYDSLNSPIITIGFIGGKWTGSLMSYHNITVNEWSITKLTVEFIFFTMSFHMFLKK